MNEEASVVLGILETLHHSTGGWYRGVCPFCPSRRGKSGGDTFGVNSETGGYNCFRCGVRGWVKVPPWFGFGAAPAVPEPVPERRGIDPPEGFLDFRSADVWESIVARPARRYLEGRGIGPEIVRSARIGVVLSGYYGGRVVVPIFGSPREWLGWVARDYTGSADRKYLYPRGMARGSILYRGETLRVETDEPAIVVEGVFDALPHLPRTVAVLGKPSHQHVEMLAETSRPISVVLDGDSWEEAEALALRLRLRGVRAGWVRLPPGTDPAETDSGWLKREAARSVAS